MTIDEVRDKYNICLPKELIYPLPDEVLDGMLEHWQCIQLTTPQVEWFNRVDLCTLMALIELKELRRRR